MTQSNMKMMIQQKPFQPNLPLHPLPPLPSPPPTPPTFFFSEPQILLEKASTFPLCVPNGPAYILSNILSYPPPKKKIVLSSFKTLPLSGGGSWFPIHLSLFFQIRYTTYTRTRTRTRTRTHPHTHPTPPLIPVPPRDTNSPISQNLSIYPINSLEKKRSC